MIISRAQNITGSAKKLFSVSLLSASLMLASQNGHAMYPTFDTASIQTAIANSAAEVSEMVVTHSMQAKDMLQDKMLSQLEMLSEQYNTATEVMRVNKVSSDIFNNERMRDVQPATGVCVMSSAQDLMKTVACDVADKAAETSKALADKYTGTSDTYKDSSEQAKETMDEIAAVNAAAKASGSNLTVENAATVMGKGNRALTKEEKAVVEKAREVMLGTVPKPPIEAMKGTASYNRDKREQIRSTQFRVTAYNASTHLDNLNAKGKNGEASQMELMESLVGQWYGLQKNGEVGPSTHLQIYTGTAPEGTKDPATGKEFKGVISQEQATKELLAIEGLSLYLEYKSYEQLLRMEQLLGTAMMMQMR